MRVREWQDIVYQLTTVCEELGFKLTDNQAEVEHIHRALLSGMLSHIGFKDEKQVYKGARNSQFHIFPGSTLFKKITKMVNVSGAC